MRHICALIFLSLLLTSCFTGVEGTKRVEMSRSDVIASMPGDEDILVSKLHGVPLSQWPEGKEFIILDDRAALIFNPNTLPANPLDLKLGGKAIHFIKADKVITPGLDTVNRLAFKDSSLNYFYTTKLDLNSLQLPMIMDASILNRLDSILKGRTLWVKNPIWHNDDSIALSPIKFVPVTVQRVKPGFGAYPAKIIFSYNGKDSWLPISLPESGPASISFANQFSLTDPRALYPGISDDHWLQIQNLKLTEGMSKDEARLAIGPPKDVQQGHNSSMLYELWQYPDGSYLIFEDGLLLRYKLSR